MAGRNRLARLTGDPGFQCGKCEVVAVGLLGLKRRTVEFGGMVAFDEAEEGAGLELEAAESNGFQISLYSYISVNRYINLVA